MPKSVPTAMSPTEKAIDNMFKARAKTLKPNPSQKDVQRVVDRLVKDIREARTTRDNARKLSLMVRTGKLLKRAAYATAVTAAMILMAKQTFKWSVASMEYTIKHAGEVGFKTDDVKVLGIFGLPRRASAYGSIIAGMLATRVLSETFLNTVGIGSRKPLPIALPATLRNFANNQEARKGLSRQRRAIRRKASRKIFRSRLKVKKQEQMGNA